MALFRARRAALGEDGLQDAYWEIPGTEYVATAPASGRLNDGGRVASAWNATVDTLRREAHESPMVRARIAAEVKRFERDYEVMRSSRADARGAVRSTPRRPGVGKAVRRTSTLLTLLQTIRRFTLGR